MIKDKFSLAREFKYAIEDAAKMFGLEVNQVCVFIPERVDDFDMVERICARFLIQDHWIKINVARFNSVELPKRYNYHLIAGKKHIVQTIADQAV